MASKTLYRFNQDTLRFEPVFLRGRRLRFHITLFLSLSLALAVGALYYYHQKLELPDDILLKREHIALRQEWDMIGQRVEDAYTELAEYVHRDDHRYRVILDAEPLSHNEREGGFGGSERFVLSRNEQYPVVVTNYQRVQKLIRQLNVEKQSFEWLLERLNEKQRMWASRPAIQPIHTNDLIRLHTTYGIRFHPILRYWRDHRGLDFTALEGTPVYATGDGAVSHAYYSETYGQVVYLDHRYGFETRYAHLSRFIVKPGDEIRRGQVIGYVGNTGLSQAAHLHYEILYHRNQINPINFFQLDLSKSEFEKLVQNAEKSTTLD
jgi:hypothetical protein